MVVGTDYIAENPLITYYQRQNQDIKGLFHRQEQEATEYDFYNTLIKLPSITGSTESLDLTYQLQSCSNYALSSQFIKYYINKKWEDTWPIILVTTFVNWVNCLLVFLCIAYDPTSHFLHISLLGTNMFLIFAELIKIWVLGPERYIGIERIQYFINFASLLGIVSLFFNNIYVVFIYSIFQLTSLCIDKIEFRNRFHSAENLIESWKIIGIALRSFTYLAYFVSMIFTDDLCFCYYSSSRVYCGRNYCDYGK